MNITLNGQSYKLLCASNLRMVVEKHKRNKAPVIAELNGEIIPEPNLEQTILKEGDALELVSFVGGGSCSNSKLIDACCDTHAAATGKRPNRSNHNIWIP